MGDLQINRYLDHAVLKPEMTRREAVEAIKTGIGYKVRTVCVRPCDIDMAVELCRGSETEVCCVLGFPHGVVLSESKAAEAELYVAKGVHEIDMVANYSYIKSGLWDLVERDIRLVAGICKPAGVLLKVIFETAMLDVDQIERATVVSINAGADFVKTSTGFNGGGAAEEAVEAMLRAAAGRIKIKPSGGIRDAASAKMFIAMGAHRLGVNYSSTPAICSGQESTPSPGDAY